jgi:hypothetical protein
MKQHILAVFGYIAATFLTQATSHFLLFREHYAAVSYLRNEPIFALGISSMIVEGIVISVVYVNSRYSGKSMLDALKLSWFFGIFLVSYIAFGEAGKYIVPSVLSWIGIELLAGSVQFTLAGILIWLAHRVK